MTLTDIQCRLDDADLWFADAPEDINFAKSLCHECPVRSACLSGALSRGEEWGIWGGELFHRGQVVPFKRRRGRPRKNEAAYYEQAMRAANVRTRDVEERSAAC